MANPHVYSVAPSRKAYRARVLKLIRRATLLFWLPQPNISPRQRFYTLSVRRSVNLRRGPWDAISAGGCQFVWHSHSWKFFTSRSRRWRRMTVPCFVIPLYTASSHSIVARFTGVRDI